jgi:hypothetical protein
MSATDPNSVEPAEGTDLPGAAPQSTENEKDGVSPREKRKMKDGLDKFVNRTD